jgi:pyrimidine and pyridine-specific 5'-nucleotidase
MLFIAAFRPLRGLSLFPADPLDFDEKCDASLPLETMLSPDPRIRKLLEDIDRSKCRVWALTNAYRTVRLTSHGRGQW